MPSDFVISRVVDGWTVVMVVLNGCGVVTIALFNSTVVVESVCVWYDDGGCDTVVDLLEVDDGGCATVVDFSEVVNGSCSNISDTNKDEIIVTGKILNFEFPLCKGYFCDWKPILSSIFPYGQSYYFHD